MTNRKNYRPLWFMAGALAGTAAALLSAPASGRDARAYIGRRSREAAGDLGERGRQAMHEAVNRGRQLWKEHGATFLATMTQEYAHRAREGAGRKTNGRDAPTAG